MNNKYVSICTYSFLLNLNLQIPVMLSFLGMFFFVTSFYLKMIYFYPKIIIIIIIILKIHHLSRETNAKLEVSNLAGSSVCRAPRFDFQLDNFQIFKVKFSI